MKWAGVGREPLPWIPWGWFGGRFSYDVDISVLFILCIVGPWWLFDKLSLLFVWNTSSGIDTFSGILCGCCSYECVRGLPSLAVTTRVMPLRMPFPWLSKVVTWPNNPSPGLLSTLGIKPLDANCWGDSKVALSANGWRWGVHGSEWGRGLAGLSGDPALWLKECRGDTGSEWIPLLLKLRNGTCGEPGKGLKAVGFCKIGEPLWGGCESFDIMDLGDNRWSCFWARLFPWASFSVAYCWKSAILTNSSVSPDCDLAFAWKGSWSAVWSLLLAMASSTAMEVLTLSCSSDFGIFWSNCSLRIFLNTDVGMKDRSGIKGEPIWPSEVGFECGAHWLRGSGAPPGVVFLPCGVLEGDFWLPFCCKPGWWPARYSDMTCGGTLCKLTPPNPSGGLSLCCASIAWGDGVRRNKGEANTSWDGLTKKGETTL